MLRMVLVLAPFVTALAAAIPVAQAIPQRPAALGQGETPRDLDHLTRPQLHRLDGLLVLLPKDADRLKARLALTPDGTEKLDATLDAYWASLAERIVAFDNEIAPLERERQTLYDQVIDWGSLTHEFPDPTELRKELERRRKEYKSGLTATGLSTSLRRVTSNFGYEVAALSASLGQRVVESIEVKDPHDAELVMEEIDSRIMLNKQATSGENAPAAFETLIDFEFVLRDFGKSYPEVLPILDMPILQAETTNAIGPVLIDWKRQLAGLEKDYLELARLWKAMGSEPEGPKDGPSESDRVYSVIGTRVMRGRFEINISTADRLRAALLSRFDDTCATKWTRLLQQFMAPKLFMFQWTSEELGNLISTFDDPEFGEDQKAAVAEELLRLDNDLVAQEAALFQAAVADFRANDGRLELPSEKSGGSDRIVRLRDSIDRRYRASEARFLELVPSKEQEILKRFFAGRM